MVHVKRLLRTALFNVPVVVFRKVRHRWTLSALIFITMIATYRHLLRPTSEHRTEISREYGEQLESPLVELFEPISIGDNLHDKWIVVTSITEPSKDVAKLAQIDGWRLVVVGDMKTPANWSYPGVAYLSVPEQTTLPYRIVNSIPYNSYTRKIIGYLYAIHHGAKYIYDTDDDNHPTNGRIDFQLSSSMTGLLYRQTKYSVVNPYAHFGQPSIWPRGFPLEAINTPTNNTYTLRTLRTPAIQQGLVNKDPDVDAIFRLLNSKKEAVGAEFNITFDSRAPPFVLPVGVFAPFNSQNTLFTYEALWALLLPTSVSFRVTDIWRGYWAQRLLWLLGHKLAFYPPNAIQVRNPHDYLEDFEEEIQVYSDSGRLIAFLKQWRCEQNVSSFFQCVSQLSHDMVRERFWSEDDAILTDLWLADLNRIGYVEPSMIIASDDHVDPRLLAGDVAAGGQRTIYFSGVIQKISDHELEESDSRSDRAEKLIEFCGLNNLWSMIINSNDISTNGSDEGEFGGPVDYDDDPWTTLRPWQTTQFKRDNILLIIVFNRGHHDVIPMLDNLYRDHFPNIAYCGNTSVRKTLLSEMKETQHKFGWITRPEHITFINIDMQKGYFSYECMMRAIEMKYSVDGYFLIGDDVLLNYWSLDLDVNLAAHESRPYKNFSRHMTPIVNKTAYFWGQSVGYNATNALLDDLALQLNRQQEVLAVDDPLLLEYSRNLNAKNLTNRAASGFSDLYYIPSSKADLFLRVASLFWKHRVFVEMTVPMVIQGLHPTRLASLYGANLKKAARIDWPDRYDPDAHYLHPVKLNDVMNKWSSWEKYCNTYVKELLPTVYGWPAHFVTT